MHNCARGSRIHGDGLLCSAIHPDAALQQCQINPDLSLSLYCVYLAVVTYDEEQIDLFWVAHQNLSAILSATSPLYSLFDHFSRMWVSLMILSCRGADRFWYSPNDSLGLIKIVKLVPAGSWEVFLRIEIENERIKNSSHMRRIRLALPKIWFNKWGRHIRYRYPRLWFFRMHLSKL